MTRGAPPRPVLCQLRCPLYGAWCCDKDCDVSDAGIYEDASLTEDVTVLGPDAFVNRITEVCGFFGQDGLVALAALVLLETSVLLDDAGIVHGDERVLAFRAVEPLLGEAFVFLGQDACPQQELVVLRRLHAGVRVLLHCPAVTLQPLDGQLVVRLLGVGTTGIAVAVAIVVHMLIEVVAVVVAELVHEGVDHGIVFFVTLDEELVDVGVHGVARQLTGDEIVVALLRHFEEAGGTAPVGRDFDGLRGAAVQVAAAVVVVGQLLPVVTGVFGKVAYEAVVGGIVVDVAFVQLVVAGVYLVHHVVQDFNHERQLVHDLILVQDVLHAHVGNVVEDGTQDEQRTVARYKGSDALAQADGFVPDFPEQPHVAGLSGVDELHLQADNLVPDLEEPDAAFVLVVAGRLQQPLLFGRVGHGREEGVAVVLEDGAGGLAAEDVFVATVGRSCFLVEFHLVQRQGFVGDVVVGIRATAVAALGQDVKHVPVAEGNGVLERHDVFVGTQPALDRAAADHVVAHLLHGIPLAVSQHLQHLEGRWQGLCESLADGGLRQGGNSAWHGSDVVVYHGTGDKRLTRGTRVDDIAVAVGLHQESGLCGVYADDFLPNVLFHFQLTR